MYSISIFLLRSANQTLGLLQSGPVRAGGGPGAQGLRGGPLKPNIRSKFPVQENLALAAGRNL